MADSGVLKEKDYTLYWQGKSSGEHIVGVAVRNSLLSMIGPGSNGSERLLTLRLKTMAGPITLVSVYAPTKDEFYENLAAIVSSVPINEQRVLLDDFNTRVGADCQLVLSGEAPAQGFLETPALEAVAPIESDHIQECRCQERSTHTLLPQCGLQHRPLIGVLQDQTAAERYHRTKKRIDVSKMSQRVRCPIAHIF